MERPPLFTSRSLFNLALLVPVLAITSSRQRWRPATPPPVAGQFLLDEAVWTGNAERKLQLLSRAVALAPESSQAQNERALQLLRMNRPEEALQSIAAALALEPESADLHFNRGNILLELHRPQPAIAAYSRSLELNPAPLTYLNRGSAYVAQSEPEQALSDFRRAAELAPDLPGVQELILELARRTKDGRK